MLSNKVYNVLKWITLVVLPALSAAYYGLAPIWGFPYAGEITGTVAVICTFLGAVLGISTIQYNKTNGEK